MMIRYKKVLLIILLSFLIASAASLAEDDYPSILPLQERATVINHWTSIRLNTLLPKLMRREGFDMWIIICREYNEDPVYYSLATANSYAARRLTILVFYDRGEEEGIERLSVSRYGIGDFYKVVWNPKEMDQWECLGKVVKERDPKKIGINESDLFAFGDGLSASLKKKLVEAIGPQYAARLHSAERLAVGWLETRVPEELETYPHIVRIAHTIIKEAFSNEVITPGITTTQHVEWWIAQKMRDLGLLSWFHPSVSIQRMKAKEEGEKEKSKSVIFEDISEGVIHRGDILHCDIGITYLRLNTDTQEHAYVLRQGETDVPEGLKKALKTGNRCQDILTGEFKEGRTGNEILLAALKKAKEEGIKPSIYSHPLGFHGHAAGPTIGLWDQQEGVPGQGDYPLFYDTCYAIELNIKTELPEWNGQEIQIALEQDAAFTPDGIYYIDGRQTEFHIIH
jgi:hypothetical protein